MAYNATLVSEVQRVWAELGSQEMIEAIGFGNATIARENLKNAVCMPHT